MIGLVTDSFEITSVNDEVWTNSTGRRGRVTCSNEVRGGYRYLAPCVRGSRAAEFFQYVYEVCAAMLRFKYSAI